MPLAKPVVLEMALARRLLMAAPALMPAVTMNLLAAYVSDGSSLSAEYLSPCGRA